METKKTCTIKKIRREKEIIRFEEKRQSNKIGGCIEGVDGNLPAWS